jgi:hypothetical protein
MCARVHWRFVCLRGRRFWALPAWLTAARSRSHHAPARRTKLTTDSRLLSLSQEPIACENLSANQNKPIVHWIFGKVPNNFLSYDLWRKRRRRRGRGRWLREVERKTTKNTRRLLGIVLRNTVEEMNEWGPGQQGERERERSR